MQDLGIVHGSILQVHHFGDCTYVATNHQASIQDTENVHVFCEYHTPLVWI